MKKYLFPAFLYAGALSMLIMSFHFFQHEISGILRGKDIAAQGWFRLLFKAHVFFGIVAIFLGPAQFWPRFRNRYLAWHRRLGYGYLGAVLISAMMGLFIAQYAMGGMITRIGFSILAGLWFGTAVAAIQGARRGDIRVHRKWMFLNYGLTFAAITQRTLLLVPLLTTVPFMPIYQLSAWLPWMINTGIAFYLLRKLERKEKVFSLQS